MRRRAKTVAAPPDPQVDARFGAEAAEAEQETEQSGQAYDAAEVFDYLEQRARGTSAKRPEPKPWRRSG